MTTGPEDDGDTLECRMLCRYCGREQGRLLRSYQLAASIQIGGRGLVHEFTLARPRSEWDGVTDPEVLGWSLPVADLPGLGRCYGLRCSCGRGGTGEWFVVPVADARGAIDELWGRRRVATSFTTDLRA